MLLYFVEKEGHCNPGRWVSTQAFAYETRGLLHPATGQRLHKDVEKKPCFFFGVCVKAEDDRRTGNMRNASEILKT